jgi:hypothetical protein
VTDDTKTGGPAFPHLRRQISQYEFETISGGGMSLRDYFAENADLSQFNPLAHALDMRSAQTTYTTDEPSLDEVIAAIADLKFKIADAMLRTREAS